jgi:hypothetical protein
VPFTPFTPGTPDIWQPSDNGLLWCNQQPELPQNTQLLLAGRLYLIGFVAHYPFTATNIWTWCATVGAGASTGSFNGLYNSSGTLLSGSSDNGTAYTTLGPIETPLSAPQQILAGGLYWIAVLVNLATTQPTLRRSGGQESSGVMLANVNLPAAQYRYAVNGTGLTSLAAITPSSNSQASGNNLGAFWAGIS